jgi:hypothetical protein
MNNNDFSNIPYKVIPSTPAKHKNVSNNNTITFYLQDCKVGIAKCLKEKSVDINVANENIERRTNKAFMDEWLDDRA